MSGIQRNFILTTACIILLCLIQAACFAEMFDNIPNNAAIAGRILDEKGKPVKNTLVAANVQEESINKYIDSKGNLKISMMGGIPPTRLQKIMHGEALTRADGSYEIRGLTEGLYDIDAKLMVEGYPALIAPVQVGVKTKSAATIQTESITLTEGTTFCGDIVDKATGKPLPEVLVHYTDRERTFTAEVKTDQWGGFCIHVLPGKGSFGLFPYNRVRLDQTQLSASDREAYRQSKVEPWSDTNHEISVIDVGKSPTAEQSLYAVGKWVVITPAVTSRRAAKTDYRALVWYDIETNKGESLGVEIRLRKIGVIPAQKPAARQAKPR